MNNTLNSHEYHVTLSWNGGRKGVMCSPEVETSTSNACIDVATPPEFPKGIPGIWSPEHLFTAAVSSCLMTTFLAIAENSGLEFKAFSCPSTGKLSKVEGKYVMTEVVLAPQVTILGEHDRALAERVVRKAAEACLISNSIKSTVSVKPQIITAELVTG